MSWRSTPMTSARIRRSGKGSWGTRLTDLQKILICNGGPIHSTHRASRSKVMAAPKRRRRDDR